MDRLLSMRVFERVVDEGGFAAAARSLDLSPPVVTRLVADLEEHLGTRLLQRTTRRQSLTDAGHVYLSRVREILQEIDEADALASAHTRELAGVLRVHAPPVLASYVVAPMLAGFRASHPDIRIELDVDSLRDLPIEEFDVTLLGTDAGFDADVVARTVIETEAILVASPDYVRRRGMPATPRDLSGHDCLQLAAPGVPARIIRCWRPGQADEVVELEIEPVVSTNHTDTALHAVLDGAGIASVSIDLVASYLIRGELVRVLDPWITGRLAIYAAMPSRKFIPRRTRAFIDYLIEHTRGQIANAMAATRAGDAAPGLRRPRAEGGRLPG
ncbi:MAG: LysR family transcriptional regulator [Pseudomonadota bacterium]|nr:LysR family transcriptional regulator [Pseudomonadota bacterium]